LSSKVNLDFEKNSVVWTCVDQIQFFVSKLTLSLKKNHNLSRLASTKFPFYFSLVTRSLVSFAPVHIFSLKMPKVTKTKAKVNREYISEFGSEVFQTDGSVLRCIPCDSPVQSNQRSQVTQHLATKMHAKNIEIQQKRVQQLFITASFENQGKLIQRSLEMCAAFNAADIPCLAWL
jgi:hypothetical protein